MDTITNTKDFEEQAGRFSNRYRRRIQDLVAYDSRIADLADSFPALLFALGSKYGSRKTRERTVRLVCEGRPLREVAAHLRIPYWLRKFPPEAFTSRLLPLPPTDEAGIRFLASIPQQVSGMESWLRFVPRALQYCDEEFAVWFANQRMFNSGRLKLQELFSVALYAWFSRRPYSYAGSLIEKPWNTSMGYETALELVSKWFRRVRAEMYLRSMDSEDSWLKPMRIKGYDFVPILSPRDLRLEAMKMKNCVDRYAEKIRKGECRLFSIRQKGQHIATLEIEHDPINTGKPILKQLRGVKNEASPDAVWRAVYSWLGKQPAYCIPEGKLQPERDGRIWRKLWMPYLERTGPVPYLSPYPGVDRLGIMDADQVVYIAE